MSRLKDYLNLCAEFRNTREDMDLYYSPFRLFLPSYILCALLVSVFPLPGKTTNSKQIE